MGSKLIVFPVFRQEEACVPHCLTNSTDFLKVELPDDVFSSEGWCKGDYAIIHLREKPENGQAGAVRAHGEIIIGFIFYGNASDVFVIASDLEADSRHYLAGEYEVLGVITRICKSCERGECFGVDGRSEHALPPINKLAQ